MAIPHVEKLQEFGLSEKEAKVYFAALELGNATADQISKQSGVNRSTTYVQIEELMHMGLMSTHEEGKKTMFSAESPNHLKRYFRKKIDALETQAHALDTFVPELGRIFDAAGERPVVRFFQGKEGLSTMRDEVLKKRNTTIYLAFSFDYLWDIYTHEELMEFTNTRAERNINSMVIYNKAGEDIVAIAPQGARRVSTEKFPFESDVYIFDNKVAVASTKGKIAGVIIESQAIANTFLSLFNLAWEAADTHENENELKTDRAKPNKAMKKKL